MIDWQNRLFKDCILARFEDGKLNPKVTFMALAAFLDIPYTESMTYCSQYGERDPESHKGNVRGFDPVAVYRTYDEFVDDNARYFREYFTRDVYTEYGYDFLCYDGAPVDQAQTETIADRFTVMGRYIRSTWEQAFARAMRRDAACWLGDANKQSIHKIWHGELLEKIRGLHRRNAFKEVSVCRDCYLPRETEDEDAFVNGRKDIVKNYVSKK